MPDPFVSCVMVTQPARRGFLRRSVADYAAQTYGRRELVVVVDEGEGADTAAVRQELAAWGRDDIRVIVPSGPLTLGALRNVSRGAARGDVTVQWDDDDRHHPDRVRQQVAAWCMAGMAAVCLTEVVLYTPHLDHMMVCNWVATPERCMPATLLCAAAVAIDYPETGPAARRGEDAAVVAQLGGLGGVWGLAGVPHLYLYVRHEGNTVGPAHMGLLTGTLALSCGLLRRREAALRAGLGPFDVGGAVVHGSNGVAFTL